ncbi:MAG: phosphoribosylglycinamide formyltransferase [Leadbetterella sp.]
MDLAIFASGSGSNAENIQIYFDNHPKVNISLIVTNNPEAGVIKRAHRLGVPCLVLNKETLKDENNLIRILAQFDIDYIILAGYLWLIPGFLVNKYPNKIINIHPALLPKYGGKGMYGQHVHEAVYNNKEKESGITIHFVNEQYDKGEFIFQATCKLSSEDTPEDIAQKVHQLEYEHFPKIIEKVVCE